MKILVVEDDESVRGMIRAALTQAGYTVEAAASGIEALPVAMRNRPDAILMDLHAAGTEEVLKLRIPVLYLCGDPRERVRPLLQKPFTIHDLLEGVTSLLRAQGARGV